MEALRARVVAAVALACVVGSAAATADQVDQVDEVVALPGLAEPLLERTFSGLLPVGDQSLGRRELFYLLSAPRLKPPPQGGAMTAPLLLWLNGGPGSSSLTGALGENGAYSLRADDGNGTLGANAHAWNRHAWTLFVDQPVGTGYSHCEAEDGYASTLEQAAHDLAELLEALLSGRHAAELADAPLWISGESFAGRYLPWLAEALVLDDDAGKRYPRASKAFAGLVVGNPESDTLLQYPPTADMLRGLGYLGDEQVAALKAEAFRNCSALVQSWPASARAATEACERWCDEVVAAAGGPFRYDARVWGNPLDALGESLSKYLNSPAAKSALHVPAAYRWKSGDGETEPNKVSAALYGEIERPGALERLGRLLAAGYRVVVYCGNMDGSPFNHISTERALLRGVAWPRAAEFRTSRRRVWRGEGEEPKPVYGFVREGGGLSFMTVSNAGHLVPRDQPAAALALITGVIFG